MKSHTGDVNEGGASCGWAGSAVGGRGTRVSDSFFVIYDFLGPFEPFFPPIHSKILLFPENGHLGAS